MKVVQGLYYSEDHEWVKVDGDKAYIGITDYAQHALGDIVFVELPDVDDEIENGGEIGAVESVKAASDVLSPLEGTVAEVNEDLEDEPSLLNADAYENWIVCLELEDKDQLDNLMSAEAYEKFCAEEE